MNVFDATACCPSITSMVGRLVNQLLWPDADAANSTIVGYGPISCAWLAKYDRAGVWRRTRSGFCQLMLDGHGEPFSERWSRWAMVVDGAYGVLAISALPTGVSASSCWPTFLASEATHGGPSQRDSAGRPTLSALIGQWPTPAAIDIGSGRINQSASPHAAMRPTLAWMARNTQWPTPQARDTRTGSLVDSPCTQRQARQGWSPNLNDTALWPTPQADNANNGRNLKEDGTRYQEDGTYGPTLVDAVTRWPTPRAEKIDGHASMGYRPTLQQAVERWPTPKAGNANGAGQHGTGSPDLQTVVTRWPTPQARDWKNGQASNETREKNARPLSEQVGEREPPMSPSSLSLNADWVEALMGFPPSWSIPAFPPGQGNHQGHGNRREPSLKGVIAIGASDCTR